MIGEKFHCLPELAIFFWSLGLLSSCGTATPQVKGVEQKDMVEIYLKIYLDKSYFSAGVHDPSNAPVRLLLEGESDKGSKRLAFLFFCFLQLGENSFSFYAPKESAIAMWLEIDGNRQEVPLGNLRTGTGLKQSFVVRLDQKGAIISEIER